MFPNYQKSADSIGGVATVDIEAFRAEKVTQISVHNVATGNGTVTLTAKPFGVDEYQPLADGTVDLTASPTQGTFTVEASLRSVRATSTDSGDAFTLTVGT